MMLLDSERVRIVNKEGIDCVYNYKLDLIETYFALPGFKLDNFIHKHFIIEKLELPYDDYLRRMLRSAANYR